MKKNNINMSSAELAQTVVKVKLFSFHVIPNMKKHHIVPSANIFNPVPNVSTQIRGRVNK